MNVGSICTRRVVTVDTNASLAHAAALMRDHHVGALVVTAQRAEGLHVGGIVTDRDLVVDLLANGLSPSAGRVGDLASASPASVSESDDLARAIAALQQAGVRRLLVTDADQRLAGILSFDDVVQALAQQFAGLAGALRVGLEHEAAVPKPAPALPPGLLRIPAMGTAGWGQGGVR